MFKIATTLAATVGLASAQSWTDSAGLCPALDADTKKSFEAADGFYPKEESISIDDLSLHEMVMEFDPTSKGDKLVDPTIKCLYFLTQGDELTQKQSDRWCVDEKAKKLADEEKLTPKSDATTIPLWNVKRIDTNVLEENGIVDMTFTMRYTNFSTSDGYYTADQKNLDSDEITQKVDADELPDADERAKFPGGLGDNSTIIANVHPEYLGWDDENQQWVFKQPPIQDLLNGNYIRGMFDYSMKRTADSISVSFKNPGADEVPKIGCSIDILAGSTIKGAKFKQDAESSDYFLKTLAFRVQPFVETYDTTHSYSQNGDQYSVGYDNDFYDGKVEYTANGYSPQSFSWKLSRSSSTSVVATALTIAGALIGTWAF